MNPLPVALAALVARGGQLLVAFIDAALVSVSW